MKTKTENEMTEEAPNTRAELEKRIAELAEIDRIEPVSYTHLTLPTSDLV